MIHDNNSNNNNDNNNNNNNMPLGESSWKYEKEGHNLCCSLLVHVPDTRFLVLTHR